MDTATLTRLLERLQSGEATIDSAVAELRTAAADPQRATINTGDARVDLDRQRRCGFPEVVFAQGKTPDAVVRIFEVLEARGQDCLATRVNEEQAAALTARFPLARHNATARIVRMMLESEAVATNAGRVVVATAGTSDLPVAEEAVETLRWMRTDVELIVDIGVAGPQRLMEQLPRLDGAAAVVVVAGMEGALPSVVGGWVPCPVVAVPTSVGYGASFGGLAALLGMLNSCAANVTVVNIDAGFKGGYIAGLIARQRRR